jgi:hypothetical protein
MAQRTLTRVLVVTALLCILTLALPPRAQAAPLGGAENLWGWLTGLVESRISLHLWGHAAPPRQAPTLPKGGFGQDPNGGMNPPPPGGSACSSCIDGGYGQDPNG